MKVFPLKPFKFGNIQMVELHQIGSGLMASRICLVSVKSETNSSVCLDFKKSGQMDQLHVINHTT